MLTVAMAVLLCTSGFAFYLFAERDSQRADMYLNRAVFNAECSSPSESNGCAVLYYSGDVSWPAGVETTDNEVLLAYASQSMELGSMNVSLASLFVGMAGVALAAAVFLRGQEKVRLEIRQTREF